MKQILSRRMLVTILLGFSSGLPLLATGGTLQAWMTDEGIDLKTIGLATLFGLPYTVKFLWAPVFDAVELPFLGRRRGWMLLTQLLTMLSLAGLALTNPSGNPLAVAIAALFVSFFSASQDIVLDAHRRDTLKDEELGLGSSLFVNGYRLGMLMSGAIALSLADHFSWISVYLCIAAAMVVGMVGTWFAPEPERISERPRGFQQIVVMPLKDFFTREAPLLILAFILLFKLGDALVSAMSTAFILKELNFSKTELAAIAKTFGLVSIILGGLSGGIIMLKIGLNRALWVCGFFQSVSILSFAWMATVGHSLPALTFVVGFENFCSGMGTTGFTAYMASVCNRRFSATQYALLSSLMGVPRVVFSSTTGILATSLGWVGYFVFCGVVAIPGMLLLLWIAPWNGAKGSDSKEQ